MRTPTATVILSAVFYTFTTANGKGPPRILATLANRQPFLIKIKGNKVVRPMAQQGTGKGIRSWLTWRQQAKSYGESPPLNMCLAEGSRTSLQAGSIPYGITIPKVLQHQSFSVDRYLAHQRWAGRYFHPTVYLSKDYSAAAPAGDSLPISRAALSSDGTTAKLGAHSVPSPAFTRIAKAVNTPAAAATTQQEPAMSQAKSSARCTRMPRA